MKVFQRIFVIVLKMYQVAMKVLEDAVFIVWKVYFYIYDLFTVKWTMKIH